MSEYETFIHIAKGSRSDAAVLITTFLLTVLFDLTLAIEIGMVLAVFLFMRKMIKISNVSSFLNENADANGNDENAINKFNIPDDVEVFELSGPMFFGAAYKFKDAIKVIEKKLVRAESPARDSALISTYRRVLFERPGYDKEELIISVTFI